MSREYELNRKPSFLIIDGQALFLSLGKTSCNTFEDLADKLMNYILRHGKPCDRIDTVLNRYCNNSIKEITRINISKRTRKLIINWGVFQLQNWINILVFP